MSQYIDYYFQCSMTGRDPSLKKYGYYRDPGEGQMKRFSHMNQSSLCPVCGRNDDKPVVLIPVDGTKDKDGRLCEAIQLHCDCIALRAKKIKEGVIVLYQTFLDKDKKIKESGP